jgi:hypothetical protein
MLDAIRVCQRFGHFVGVRTTNDKIRFAETDRYACPSFRHP